MFQLFNVCIVPESWQTCEKNMYKENVRTWHCSSKLPWAKSCNREGKALAARRAAQGAAAAANCVTTQAASQGSLLWTLLLTLLSVRHETRTGTASLATICARAASWSGPGAGGSACHVNRTTSAR